LGTKQGHPHFFSPLLCCELTVVLSCCFTQGWERRERNRSLLWEHPKALHRGRAYLPCFKLSSHTRKSHTAVLHYTSFCVCLGLHQRSMLACSLAEPARIGFQVDCLCKLQRLGQKCENLLASVIHTCALLFLKSVSACVGLALMCQFEPTDVLNLAFV
jgi:hypothetical protein